MGTDHHSPPSLPATAPATTVPTCLARYHDGSAKPNWGGRATSAALARVATWNGRQVVSVINGRLIVKGLGTDHLHDHVRWAVGEVQRRVPAWPRPPVARYRTDDFLRIEERARQLLRRAARPAGLTQAIEAMERAGELWMNGEGDLILVERPTLLRTLLLVHLAAELGLTVRLVNSILSAAPGREPVPQVTDAVGAALARCATVQYRDPESLALHGELFPDLPGATWAPDALFAWAIGDVVTALDDDLALGDGPATERLPIEVQAMIRERREYVVVSGTSALGPAGATARDDDLTALLAALRAAALEPVVAATCASDGWMLPVAERAGVATVPASVPLISALVLLGRAQCLASGRYHPTILAAVSGTPSVLMGSNSHKTRSLQVVLGEPAVVEDPPFGAGLDVRAFAARAAAVAGATEARPHRLDAARALAARLVLPDLDQRPAGDDR